MKNKHPIISYGRQCIDRRDIAAVVNVLKSEWLTQGSKVTEFESKLAEYCNARYAVVVSSGTAALHIACLAAGLKKGDEAITTPLTFVATCNAVHYSGAKPVFADINPVTANIEPKEILRKISSRTKAILPVHYAGLPCNMPEIRRISQKKGITVIEDACHALGAQYKYKGKWIKVGSCAHSDMAVFSFHPVKSITTGEGGAVLTNSKDLYEKLLLLRNHGITRDASRFIYKKNRFCYYEMQELGFNYRITDFQCALGISQLKKLDFFIQKRALLASEYAKNFSGNPYFSIPSVYINLKSSWHLYAIRLNEELVDRKEQLYEELRSRGILAQVHYIPVYWHPYYRRNKFSAATCVEAESFYRGQLSIPLYPSMQLKDVRRVSAAVLDIIKRLL